MRTTTDLINDLSSSAPSDRLSAFDGLFPMHRSLVATYASKRLTRVALAGEPVELSPDDVVNQVYVAMHHRIAGDALALGRGLPAWYCYVRKTVASTVNDAHRRRDHLSDLDSGGVSAESSSHHRGRVRVKKFTGFVAHSSNVSGPLESAAASCVNPVEILMRAEATECGMAIVNSACTRLTDEERQLLEQVWGAYQGAASSVAQVGKAIGVPARKIHALFDSIRRAA
jgi:hypothetical protein